VEKPPFMRGKATIYAWKSHHLCVEKPPFMRGKLKEATIYAWKSHHLCVEKPPFMRGKRRFPCLEMMQKYYKICVGNKRSKVDRNTKSFLLIFKALNIYS
jgi:hypothetical protein